MTKEEFIQFFGYNKIDDFIRPIAIRYRYQINTHKFFKKLKKTDKKLYWFIKKTYKVPYLINSACNVVKFLNSFELTESQKIKSLEFIEDNFNTEIENYIDKYFKRLFITYKPNKVIKELKARGFKHYSKINEINYSGHFIFHQASGMILPKDFSNSKSFTAISISEPGIYYANKLYGLVGTSCYLGDLPENSSKTRLFKMWGLKNKKK